MSGLSQCCLVNKPESMIFSTVQNFGAHTFCLISEVLLSIAGKIARKETEDWKTGQMKMPGTFQFGERMLKEEGF